MYFTLKAHRKYIFVSILRREVSRFKSVTVHGLVRVWQKCGQVTLRVRYFLPLDKKTAIKMFEFHGRMQLCRELADKQIGTMAVLLRWPARGQFYVIAV